ncbi:MAG TPA: dTDP-4-dehydrorhamnose reductase [Candidatus Binatia bacterium]|nr:dTDP-4-dehydrorhamnose reductase [Candidatus Binatia bacterium]
MRVTVFGASGLLGKELLAAWKQDEITALGSSDADIRDAARVRQTVAQSRADWIVLTAAYTDVDGCEKNPQLAFAVNRDGAVNVAAAAKQSGARLLFISSDYVFDGKKTRPYETGDPRNPQSVYGKTKAEAEIGLLELLPEACIVRTSWLFGTGGKCFPDTILKLAATRPTLDVVNDQRGSPTYAADLAGSIIQLCRKNASGIVHATNSGDCTWFEFAQAIVGASGLPTEVRPSTTAQMARPAPRPAYSVLSPASLHRAGIQLPSWRDGLRRYLDERTALEGAS